MIRERGTHRPVVMFAVRLTASLLDMSGTKRTVSSETEARGDCYPMSLVHQKRLRISPFGSVALVAIAMALVAGAVGCRSKSVGSSGSRATVVANDAVNDKSSDKDSGKSADKNAPIASSSVASGAASTSGSLTGDAAGEAGTDSVANQDGACDGMDGDCSEKTAMALSDQRIYSIAIETYVRALPSRSGRVLGYLRIPGGVRRSAEPVGTDGCKDGWYAVEPEGYVCNGPAATLDDSAKILQYARPGARRDAPMPFSYAFVRPKVPHYYHALPSMQDIKRI